MAGGGGQRMRTAMYVCRSETLLRVSAPFPPHGSNLGGLVRLGDKSLLQAGPDLKRFRSSKLRHMRVGGGTQRGGGDSAVKTLATMPKAYRWKERTNFHNLSSDLLECQGTQMSSCILINNCNFFNL